MSFSILKNNTSQTFQFNHKHVLRILLLDLNTAKSNWRSQKQLFRSKVTTSTFEVLYAVMTQS